MKVSQVRKSGKRVETKYISRLGIQSYGADNLYPQDLMQITHASGTAELCLSRYAKFIEGFGFSNTALSEVLANAQGETLDDILHNLVLDVARFGGIALHVNYNVLGEVSSVHHVPFENCRLAEKDDAGHVEYICIHDDWSGNSTRRGQKVQVNENTIDRIHAYNPRKEVVQAQIIESGGIEHYKGQVLYVGLHGKGYPIPIYDACVTDISTDEGLGNVKYRNARNNFLVSCMLIAKKGQPNISADGRIEQEQMISDDDLKQFQGDEKTGKILYVELENDEDKPEVVEFPARNFDKDFEVTESSIVERIYAQFHQEIFHAVRIGKLGFSGDVMREAYEYYAGEVTHEQRFIERVFAKVFADWHEPLPSYDFSIAPLRYVNSETTNTTTDGGQGNG